MRYTLSREDYQGLVLFPSNATKQDGAEILEQEYPRSTEAAVEEMRARGIDVRKPMIDYLLKKGELPEPAGGDGRNRKWTPADIDRAIELVEDQQLYVPGTITRMFLNIDPAEDVREQQRVFAENPDLPPDASLFVMEIVPGAPGVGVYAKVRYRRMTKQEEAERVKRIAAATKPKGGSRR